MGRKSKLTLTLTEQQDGTYVLSWQDPILVESSEPNARTMTMQEIEAYFPKFCSVNRECHSELNSAVNLN